MAPSVIYIDEAEKVFVADKKRAKEFGGQVRPPLPGAAGDWQCQQGGWGSG